MKQLGDEYPGGNILGLSSLECRVEALWEAEEETLKLG
jgi:hypothetical protein